MNCGGVKVKEDHKGSRDIKCQISARSRRVLLENVRAAALCGVEWGHLSEGLRRFEEEESLQDKVTHLLQKKKTISFLLSLPPLLALLFNLCDFLH